MRRLGLPLLAVIVAAVLSVAALAAATAARSGEDSDGLAPPGPSTERPVDAVALRNTALLPDVTAVRGGEDVTWTNNDPQPHHLVAQSGAEFDSKPIGIGEAFSFKTPRGPVEITYICRIHPDLMQGTLKVLEG